MAQNDILRALLAPQPITSEGGGYYNPPSELSSPQLPQGRFDVSNTWFPQPQFSGGISAPVMGGNLTASGSYQAIPNSALRRLMLQYSREF